MVNEIHVLFNGYSFNDPHNPEIQKANCTCTLIKCENNFNIIIDTMTPWDKDRIVNALSLFNLKPEDINVLVCTHGHSDHVGNNNLFVNAKYHIVGQCVSNQDKYILHDFKTKPFMLTEHVSVVATPGHTLSCVSVIVDKTAEGKVGISGDLFEKYEDIDDPSIWIDAGSESATLQKENRLMLANLVDFIIPGHGKGFKVTTLVRDKLK